ncbi:MAG: hypothetical protein HY043_12015 [Verrucomicrobia bacterium]|nr:hypothetical protein [Verrucomicrobiota bacterium]
MKKMNYLLAVASVAAVLGLNAGSVNAQNQQTPPPAGQGGGGGGGGRGRGNFDPEQMRQRQMERYKEQLDVSDEAEWKVISGLIEKVSTARRETGGGFGGFGRGGGGPGGPGGGGQGGGGGGRAAFGGQQLPEAEALQKAIEAKASSDEIKTKLAKYREARKVKEANLEKAQEELRKVLSVKQEAAAVLAGLLK